MRHMKQFEGFFDPLPIKKYVVFKSRETLFIFETEVNALLGDINPDVGIKKVGEYRNNKLYTSEGNKVYREWWIIKNDILFQSDDLEECKNMMPILADTIDYNIL